MIAPISTSFVLLDRIASISYLNVVRKRVYILNLSIALLVSLFFIQFTVIVYRGFTAFERTTNLGWFFLIRRVLKLEFKDFDAKFFAFCYKFYISFKGLKIELLFNIIIFKKNTVFFALPCRI